MTPCFWAKRTRRSRARCISLASVGKVIAFSWTVVSTITCWKSAGLAAPVRVATARLSCKALLQGSPARLSCKALLQGSPTRLSCKALLQGSPARLSCKALLQGSPARLSCKALLQGSPARLSCKALPDEGDQPLLAILWRQRVSEERSNGGVCWKNSSPQNSCQHGVSIQRSQSTSSERSCMCLRIAKPAISRVGSGGRPGSSV